MPKKAKFAAKPTTTTTTTAAPKPAANKPATTRSKAKLNETPTSPETTAQPDFLISPETTVTPTNTSSKSITPKSKTTTVSTRSKLLHETGLEPPVTGIVEPPTATPDTVKTKVSKRGLRARRGTGKRVVINEPGDDDGNRVSMDVGSGKGKEKMFYQSVAVNATGDLLSANVNDKPFIVSADEVASMFGIPYEGLEITETNGWPPMDASVMFNYIREVAAEVQKDVMSLPKENAKGVPKKKRELPYGMWLSHIMWEKRILSPSDGYCVLMNDCMKDGLLGQMHLRIDNDKLVGLNGEGYAGASSCTDNLRGVTSQLMAISDTMAGGFGKIAQEFDELKDALTPLLSIPDILTQLLALLPKKP